ncbi:serine/threonine-protein kinase [Cerasibacillus quisquiliarum]|uniref:Serine/threonine-protein kinase PrkC n=1 Tax=Cerasibacillus quisquiliarum TaxID=227865 RepID=A0A511UZ33_9BACI|nr:Stk1 family PASTA domain-containing Ser/Thr kinase [Cerasibacillus quisquiliarum]MBB5145811.1 serine/threonine-protein kinase [Cerasibacillus quisquiliarum]GEN30382.1 serine/threonine-protein kinase PrkC [Cerasibacillus quisquiliarum]
MLKGHILDDRYQIIEMIGGGGMANVYLAKDLILNRQVAIKMLRMEFANDEEFIARFDREAQSATSLSHPNIVNIYDVGDEEHLLYMVMEYVDGMTLKEYIHRFSPLPMQDVVDIMKQITSAIHHAHEHNIIHRDIKPQNILIDQNGKVKVTDFGIAIALSSTALTQTNSILGSVHYLSPEQARGGLATKKSDIYSLGIVFFELLTGRLPFSGHSPVSIALKHLQNNTPSVRRYQSDIPQSIENIVLRATAKDPFHRFQSVSDMYHSLETALDPNRVNEPKYSPPEEVGEETKAIPIITNLEDSDISNHDETIVHRPNEKTINVSTNQNQNVKKPKKTKKKKWRRILLITFILIASGLAALFIIPGIFQPKDVVIPDVIGMTYEEAVKELEKVNLEAEKEDTHSEEVEEGLVVKTNPNVGRTAKEKSTVTVLVSVGKEKFKMEDYVGKDFDQVKRLLEEKGYEDVIAYEKHSDNPVGEILSQIQPTPDTEVIPSETKVIFEISNGPELITLNNLKGMTLEQAKSYLEDNGLKMNKKEEHSEAVSKGHVIRHSPDSGASLNKEATVDVYVSIGPEEKPPASQEVTFTVPYTEKDDNNDDEKRKEQTVKIYIKDLEHQISKVYKEDKITTDTEYTITLLIAPGTFGEYKVVRDDELIIEKTVAYQD